MGIWKIRAATHQHDTLASPPRDMVDKALSSLIAWRRYATRVREAYSRWLDAPASEEHRSFSAYVAALDQEELASARYAQAVRDVDSWWQLG